MVVLVTIDGARPDGIAKAPTPCMDRLVNDGAHTWSARSVTPSVTLPCHTSIFRGVSPQRHGITSNHFSPLARPVASLFDIAAASGRKTAMFYNWLQLRDVADPDSIHTSYCQLNADSPEGDRHITEMAMEAVRREEFDFLFLYLGHVDMAGHEFGWMSEEYLDAIANADACLNRFTEHLIALKRPVDFVILADHGGHDRGHGTDSPEDMTIPMILWGYRIEPGVKIEQPVSLLDVAPTIAHLLGLQPPREWEGQVIREAIRDTWEANAHCNHQVFGLGDE